MILFLLRDNIVKIVEFIEINKKQDSFPFPWHTVPIPSAAVVEVLGGVGVRGRG